MTGGQLRLVRDHPEFLLARERQLALTVPAVCELPLVLVRPLLRHVVRGVGRAGREVHEERLVGRERSLRLDPVDGVVGEILREVIALFGGLRRLDRSQPFVERRVVLVVLTPDEPVEVLEAATARGPCVERTHGRGLPRRDLVALAELGRAVPVQLERERDGGLRVGPHAAVARRRGCCLRDRAHTHRVVVPTRHHRGAGRSTQGSGMEAVVPQTSCRKAFGNRSACGPTERAGCSEPDVVEEDDQDVRRAFRWNQRFDRRKRRVGVLRVVGDQSGGGLVRDRQDRSMSCVFGHQALLPSDHRRLTPSMRVTVSSAILPCDARRSPSGSAIELITRIRDRGATSSPRRPRSEAGSTSPTGTPWPWTGPPCAGRRTRPGPRCSRPRPRPSRPAPA